MRCGASVGQSISHSRRRERERLDALSQTTYGTVCNIPRYVFATCGTDHLVLKVMWTRLDESNGVSSSTTPRTTPRTTTVRSSNGHRQIDSDRERERVHNLPSRAMRTATDGSSIPSPGDSTSYVSPVLVSTTAMICNCPMAQRRRTDTPRQVSQRNASHQPRSRERSRSAIPGLW
jgi:hypothetical protein